MTERLKQIRRSHKAARPKRDNIAWWNTHDDLSFVLDALELCQAENEQHLDIRSDMETLLAWISTHLGVSLEPHQTWNERLMERVGKLALEYAGDSGRG